ncbi:MAG: hypothetical protein J5858_02725 [Lentisphaeria bacterium]|nr:hypothetical protein [Lentisphaeria bacterium]
MKKILAITIIGTVLAGMWTDSFAAEKNYRGSYRLAAKKRQQRQKDEKTEPKPLNTSETSLLSKRAEIDRMRKEMLEEQLAAAKTEAEKKAIQQKYDEATARLEEQRKAEDAARKSGQTASDRNSGSRQKQTIWRGHSGSGNRNRK